MAKRRWIVGWLFACLCVATGSLVVAEESGPGWQDVLREGRIERHAGEGLYSYIEAVDEEGRTFYVISSLCRVETGQSIRVFTGTHYGKMRVPSLGGVVEDVYLARVLELDGKILTGYTEESMVPQGCTILE